MWVFLQALQWGLDCVTSQTLSERKWVRWEEEWMSQEVREGLSSSNWYFFFSVEKLLDSKFPSTLKLPKSIKELLLNSLLCSDNGEGTLLKWLPIEMKPCSGRAQRLLSSESSMGQVDNPRDEDREWYVKYSHISMGKKVPEPTTDHKYLDAKVSYTTVWYLHYPGHIISSRLLLIPNIV